MKMITQIKTFFALALMVFFTSEMTFGQCANNNAFFTSTGTIAAGTSFTFNCVWGGEYVTVGVVQGASYTFSTCGGGGWDSQITLYNNTGGSALGYNDDACGTQSQISNWVSPFTGTLRILLDRFNCSNQNSCMNLTVTRAAAAPPNPCSSVSALTCGQASGFSVTGTGAWNNLGGPYATPGGEKVYSFTPTVTGSYSVVVNSNSSWVDLFYKAGACGSTGWTYVDDVFTSGTYTLTLTAGVTYHFLIDDENASPSSGNVTINCPTPAPNPCSAVTALSCNGSVSYNTGNGAGAWNNLGGPYATPGGERVFSFTPSVTGLHTINLSNNEYYVDLYYRVGACSSTGWTYIFDFFTGSNSYSLNLTAGTTYHFLLDDENVSASSGTFGISCPVPCVGQSVDGSYTYNGPFSVSGTTVGACDDSPRSPSFDRIYAINIGCAGSYTFSSCNGATWDTHLFLTTAAGGGGTLVTSNDDACSLQSSMTASLSPGTYYLVVEGFAVTSEGAFTVNVSGSGSAPSISGISNNVSCNGGNNGSITASINGNGNNATATLNGSPFNGSASGLSAGTYNLVATNCWGSSSQIFTISQPSSLVATASAGSIACNGGTTTITVSAIGGAAPYSGTGSFTVGAGSYSYTVTDANGCSDVVNVTVAEPAVLDAAAISGTIQCNGGTTTILVSAVGGTAPYNGIGTFTVGAGSYSYTVTDANGCSDVVNVTVAEPTVLEASASATDILCNGGTSTITVSATGGTAPYTGTGFNYVGAGTYTYTVTDANGCSDQVSVTVTEPVRLVATATAGTILCNGGTTTVTVGGIGGTAPYSGTGNFTVGAGSHSFTVTDANGCTDVVNISISEPSALEASVVSGSILCNGGTTTIVVGATGGTAPYNGIGTFTVGAGSYSYTVTDANGCTDVVAITVSEPAVLEASVTSTAILCNGGTSTITVSATGGTAPYVGTGINVVGAGTYTYTIVDANGCSDQVSITVTEPTQVTVSTLSSNVSCNGAADGSAAAAGSGGTGNISYAWSNGATTASISGLAPGTYDVTATDDNGCTAVASVTITEPAALVVNGGSDHVIYLGYSASCVTLGPEQVSGGTAPYVSSWSDASGQVSATVCPTTTTTYTFTVVDANGCVATDEVTVCVVDIRCAGGNNNGQGGNGQGGQGSTNGNGIEHVLICHIPPGNPNNAMTKCIPVTAVPGHLSHGDYLGACGTVVACQVAPISGQSAQSASRTSGEQQARLGASPNPSTGTSTIELMLPSTERVNLRVYDSRGVMVADLFDGMANAEQSMRFEWNAEGLAAGLYFVRLEMMTGEVETLRLMLNP